MNIFDSFINNKFGDRVIRDDFKSTIDGLKKENTYYVTQWEKMNNNRVSLSHANRFGGDKLSGDYLTFTDFVLK